MQPVVFAMPGNEWIGAAVAREAAEWARGAAAVEGRVCVRRFPDGESHVRLEGEVAGREVDLAGREVDLAGREVIVVATLSRPDELFVPLALVAETARELGARRVGLVAPYLAYMRQDARFQAGEAVSARVFAGLLSGHFDWVVTVDPHLHRHGSLAEVFPVQAVALSAGALLADWVRAHVAEPLLVGPDAESAQWVEVVARLAGAPSVIMHKERSGDREVRVSAPAELARWRGRRQAVLVDDIASTGRTLVEAAGQLAGAGFRAPWALVVHPVLADGAERDLAAAGVRLVSTNTLVHPTNRIDVSGLVAEGVRRVLRGGAGGDAEAGRASEAGWSGEVAALAEVEDLEAGP